MLNKAALEAAVKSGHTDLVERYLSLLAESESQRWDGYLKHLTIDSRPPGPFRPEPWQQQIYNLLGPLFETAAGIVHEPVRQIFIVAPKGSSKTSTTAQGLNWLLNFAKRPVFAVAAASDADQAAILLQRMQEEARHNPFLKLKFSRRHVTGPKGTLEVLTSDAPSASGHLPDLIVCDEVTFWRRRDLADMLFAARDKRQDCVVVVIGNAGVKNTWQHDLWLAAQSSPRWITHAVPAFSATWMDQEAIKDQAKTLLPALYKRLHLNQWVDMTEECGYVTREQIEKCLDKTLSYKTQGDRNYKYVAAIDAGIVFDRSVACVLHCESDKVILDRMDVWQPTSEERMKLSQLENWTAEVLSKFHVSDLVLDPYQLETLAQKYERRVEVTRYKYQVGGGF